MVSRSYTVKAVRQIWILPYRIYASVESRRTCTKVDRNASEDSICTEATMESRPIRLPAKERRQNLHLINAPSFAQYRATVPLALLAVHEVSAEGRLEHVCSESLGTA